MNAFLCTCWCFTPFSSFIHLNGNKASVHVHQYSGSSHGAPFTRLNRSFRFLEVVRQNAEGWGFRLVALIHSSETAGRFHTFESEPTSDDTSLPDSADNMRSEYVAPEIYDDTEKSMSNLDDFPEASYRDIESKGYEFPDWRKVGNQQNVNADFYGPSLSRGFRPDVTKTRYSDSLISEAGGQLEGAANESSSSESLWENETYVRRALMARQKEKGLVLTDRVPFLKNSPPSSSVTNSFSSLSETEIALHLALRSKRHISKEMFIAAMRASELGPYYSQQIASSMPFFIDRIVVEAVALKKDRSHRQLSFKARVRMYLDQSKVVAIIKWLKHQRLTVPGIGNLISLADEKLKCIIPLVSWMKEIYVDGREIGAVLRREPQILRSPLDDLKELANVLEIAGVKRAWMGLIVSRSPGVLAQSISELKKKIQFFTELGLDADQLGVMAFNFPAIVGHFTVDEMQTKVDYLQQLGIDQAALRRILASTPQLLACNIEEAWEPLLRFFQFLDISRLGAKRILTTHPAVFCLNLDENITPKVRFLRAIGVHDDAIGQMIVGFPEILTYSLDRKIRPVVKFLLESAGVSEDNVGKVIALKPQLIGCSLDNKLGLIVAYFSSHGIGSIQLGTMVADFPALLMYNIQVINPKLLFFKHEMQRPLQDLINFPRYFSYSMKTRIVPRYQLLADKGLQFSLKSMLACNDDVFSRRVAEKLRSHEVLEESESAG